MQEGILIILIIFKYSTGSRIHIFEYQRDWFNNICGINEIGNKKQQPGLSTYVNKPELAYQEIEPLLEYAANIIPKEAQANVPIYLYATAGMRLLTLKEQDEIYNQIYAYFYANNKFLFKLFRDHIQTINGNDEGFYAWLAANYLGGTISASLKRKQLETIGALDLGGGSTQILYETQFVDSLEKPISTKNIFIKSFLGSGSQEMYDKYIQSELTSSSKSYLFEPCLYKGYVEKHPNYSYMKIKGSGNYTECRNRLYSYIYSQFDSDLINTQIPLVQGKFYAMSLYFYALHSIQSFTGLLNVDKNSTYSINEIESATKKLCNIKWNRMKEMKDQYADDTVLPYRCFQVSYISILLHDIYGFSKDSQDVSFVGNINGGEVEWTLGLALSKYQEFINN